MYDVGGGESGYIAPASDESEHLLRRQPGRAAHALRPAHRLDARHPGVSAVLLRRIGRRRCRSAGSGRSRSCSRPMDPRHAVHVVAASLADDRRRPDVADDQPRSDARRSEDARRFRRPDHARQNGPEIYGTIFTIAPSHKETGHDLDRVATTASCTSPATAGRTGRTSRRPACRSSAA